MDTKLLLEIPGKGTGVTNLRRAPLRGASAAGGAAPSPGQKAERNGPLRSASGRFRLTAGVPLNIAVGNDHRRMLVLQNLDVAQKLFWNLGAPADANSGFIPALGNLLFDYSCPTDAVWVFATVDLSGYFMEVAPIG